MADRSSGTGIATIIAFMMVIVMVMIIMFPMVIMELVIVVVMIVSMIVWPYADLQLSVFVDKIHFEFFFPCRSRCRDGERIRLRDNLVEGSYRSGET